MHLVKDFKSLTAAPPSRLIDQLGPTGDDYLARDPRESVGPREYRRSDLSESGAAVSVSY
jgi:hypothetical protein